VGSSERELDAALDAVLGDTAGAELQRAAGRLTAAYRAGALPGEQLDTPLAVRAYAAYRMPATFAAVRAALRAAAAVDPRLAPRSLLDAGGGTGAALWAAAAALPTLQRATVLDRSREALALGRALAEHAPGPVVGAATWTPAQLGAAGLPGADLVTMAYVLAELPAQAGRDLVGAAAAAAPVVAVVEPGTPAGHRRVLEARDLLIRAGRRVLAPCPHELTCPLAGGGPDGTDWCHFAARLPRSPRHRRVKGGTLGWEDEKFAYVVAAPTGAEPAAGRIVRHPQRRKGLVELSVCGRPPGVRVVPVSRRQGPDYRAARDAGWGDPWPPHVPV